MDRRLTDEPEFEHRGAGALKYTASSKSSRPVTRKRGLRRHGGVPILFLCQRARNWWLLHVCRLERPANRAGTTATGMRLAGGGVSVGIRWLPAAATTSPPRRPPTPRPPPRGASGGTRCGSSPPPAGTRTSIAETAGRRASAIATVCDPNMLLRLALRTGRGFKLWPRPEHRLIVARRQRGRIACMPNRFVMLVDSDTQSHLSWLGVRGSAGFGPRAPSGERCS
jgi:hypothetical protein